MSFRGFIEASDLAVSNPTPAFFRERGEEGERGSRRGEEGERSRRVEEEGVGGDREREGEEEWELPPLNAARITGAEEQYKKERQGRGEREWKGEGEKRWEMDGGRIVRERE